jgi:hypothetical protein
MAKDVKKLAELVRQLREQAKKKIVGTSGSFKGGAGDLQDLTGPNKPVGRNEKEQHHVEEGVDMPNPGLGARHNPSKNVFSHAKVPKKRYWQKTGNQKRTAGSYVSEDEVNLGKTSTGKSGEKIDTAPVKKELTGQLK